MSALLEIKNLTVSFPDEKENLAAKSVNLTLEKGEVTALVGESGSGKTVLCKTILRLLDRNTRIESGEILYEDRNILELTEQQMQRFRGKEIAMIFQDPYLSLNPTISIGRQIMETILLHEKRSRREAKMKTLELLSLAGFTECEKRFHQYPHEFSGGMRQRAAIAIALACSPKLLLADEPTTALDVDTQRQIIQLLKEVQEKTGVAVLFVTHDLGLVEDIAAYVYVMYQGEIAENGEVRSIFENPQDAYTKKLLGYRNYGKGIGHTHGKIHFHEGVAHIHQGQPKHQHSHVEEDISHGDSMEQTEPLLKVRNLTKTFKLGRHAQIPVLDKFNLDVYKGEILGIVGPSGCGKSTLARCIVGLHSIDGGSVDYKGTDTRPYARQMIFQDSASAFNSHMTLREIIGEPLKIQKLCSTKAELKDKVDALMKQVELDTELGDRHPYEVSGGQRQRAAIARALSLDPEIIVADEPISSLDISIQSQIMHLFKKLQEERHLTLLLIAHDLPMVMHISDRIIRMN